MTKYALCLLALIAVPVWAMPAETLQEVASDRMQPVKARIDWSLLPKDAYDEDTERGRTFVLNEGAFPATTIVPVKFKMPAPDGTGFYYSCGVFFLMPADKPRYVPIIGTGWTQADQCSGLKDIGLAPSPPKIAQLIFAYDAYTETGSLVEPVIFTWDDHLPGYALNEAASRAVQAQPHDDADAIRSSLAAQKR
jgi:hypothetical protein